MRTNKFKRKMTERPPLEGHPRSRMRVETDTLPDGTKVVRSYSPHYVWLRPGDFDFLAWYLNDVWSMSATGFIRQVVAREVDRLRAAVDEVEAGTQVLEGLASQDDV